ncbi:hypothetical protein BDN71DRAFT_1235657 [Pleurotus eryngii]|uniref:Uncharacterized protein n=1 Tax=Pleurotus eryngii TaxID=5323 RepID=A0A9P5ZQG8_PLEER|nr:hypothetical protein BDN71DRAFT_1235657 [Pleurotus eryngii]
MDDGAHDRLTALFPVFIMLALLIFGVVLWCLLSSCLGGTILAECHSLWEFLTLSSRSSRGYTPGRRRMALGEEETWELENRGRR